jgi:hypothetical protein
MMFALRHNPFYARIPVHHIVTIISNLQLHLSSLIHAVKHVDFNEYHASAQV